MTGFDRKLVDLISELTDCGMVLPLKSVLDFWGRERAARVITDGFAVVRRNADAARSLDDASFVSTEDALVLVHHLRKTTWDAPDAHLILAGPWASIGPEDEPDLIARYAADDPGAVAEVQRRHAERRYAWEQKLAST
jgi:hypothetical protein